MIAATVTTQLRDWLVSLFVKAIQTVSRNEDRQEIIQWLTLSREVISSDKSKRDKFVELYALMDSQKTAKIALNSVVESVKNYKSANLPLAVKVSVPLTLLAVPLFGGQGAGIAAFGSALGLPVLLLIFLGTTGITTIIEAFVGNANARTYLGAVMDLIARDEMLRAIKAAMKNGTQGEPAEPFRFDMPEDEAELRARLYVMDPYEFEKHVMSFFKAADMLAAATKKSGDKGVDGFARHKDGVIVVQCKRYASGNSVGSPSILQFWGAIEQSAAWRGYFVTTSDYTKEARASAELCDKMILVDMDELVRWHKNAPTF
jgi:hypothetical protein